MRWKMEFSAVIDDEIVAAEMLSLVTAGDTLQSFLAPLGVEDVKAFAFSLIDEGDIEED